MKFAQFAFVYRLLYSTFANENHTFLWSFHNRMIADVRKGNFKLILPELEKNFHRNFNSWQCIIKKLYTLLIGFAASFTIMTFLGFPGNERRRISSYKSQQVLQHLSSSESFWCSFLVLHLNVYFKWKVFHGETFVKILMWKFFFCFLFCSDG